MAERKRHEQFMPDAREAYDRGVSLNALRRRFHLSKSEMQDLAPEEFEHHAEPEGSVGGY
jgi:hypothetical protein